MFDVKSLESEIGKDASYLLSNFVNTWAINGCPEHFVKTRPFLVNEAKMSAVKIRAAEKILIEREFIDIKKVKHGCSSLSFCNGYFVKPKKILQAISQYNEPS